MRRTLILLPAPIVAIIAAAVFLTSEILAQPPHPTAEMHFDMVTAGNTYCDSAGLLPDGVTTCSPANSMTVGTIDNCLTSATANPATHTHPTHLILRNTEDLVAWTARVNFIGDQMRILSFNERPFVDSGSGQNVGFVNLPTAGGSHRTVTTAIEGGAGFPAAPADGTNTPQTTAFGAIYDGAQSFAFSPDTPAKAAPDDTSYSAPNGGILATVTLQVVGDESGQASLFMSLDNDTPNGPLGSELEIFTDIGQQTVSIPTNRLGDAFHGEGATCATLDCSNFECPGGQPEPQPTPTPGPSGPTATATPSTAGGARTPTRTAAPGAGARTPTPGPPPVRLPENLGNPDDGGWSALTYVLLFGTGIALAGSGAVAARTVFAIQRRRKDESE